MLREQGVEPCRAVVLAIIDPRIGRTVTGMRTGPANRMILDDRAVPIVEQRSQPYRLAELFDHHRESRCQRHQVIAHKARDGAVE